MDVASPEFHGNLSRAGSLGDIEVPDCRTGQGVHLRVALLRVIEGRVLDDSYECRP